MRTFRIVAAVAGLALVLSACGLVNSLIPDQSVTDPLGLNGTSVTMSAPSTPALGAQLVVTTTTLSGAFNGSFGDFDASSIPSGVHPSGFAAPIDVAATASIATATPGSLPTSFSVTGVTLDLTVKDGSGAPSFTLSPPFSNTGTLLTFTQTACTASSCDYSVAAGPDLGSALIALSLSSSDVATLWQIVTGGNATNTAQGSITVTVDQGLPADSALTVQLVSPTGTLTF